MRGILERKFSGRMFPNLELSHEVVLFSENFGITEITVLFAAELSEIIIGI